MGALKVYACYNTDKDVRLSSSSGAVFSSLAEYVLEQQGVVYGVAMSEDCYSAEFISVTDENGLKMLRGSKYLQARVGNTYKSVRHDLDTGKIVLFTGTGCQVNGLKCFLGKDYENLICVDVICHGVPSPALWKEYAQYQEKISGGKLKHINFRCKDDSWTDFGMKRSIQGLRDGKIKKKYIPKDKDPFMLMFLRDYCLRPSCYECNAKENKSSDLTMADFWGIHKVAPEMNDNRGISLVIVRTNKGTELFNRVCKNMTIKEVSYEDGIRNNPAEYRSAAKPTQRDTFFNDMYNMSFEKLAEKYAVPAKVPTKTKIKRIIKNAIKKIVRGGTNSDYGLLFAVCVPNKKKI